MTPRLYLISPADIELDSFTPIFEEAVSAGDVACFQLRLKDKHDVAAPDADILAACTRLLPIAHAHGVAFLVNDRPDLAKLAGADGVHIGQSDTPYADARSLLGDEAIIGVTCHDSRHLAMVAGEAGADYVAFGAFYPTRTKSPKSSADPGLLRWWQETMEPPCVAIGGITVENARPLLDAGADFLAVSGGVWGYADGPGKAVAAFNALCGA
ncbi:MAG: thiamine phosphate synthase [Parvibaculales bacterium]